MAVDYDSSQWTDAVFLRHGGDLLRVKALILALHLLAHTFDFGFMSLKELLSPLLRLE